MAQLKEGSVIKKPTGDEVIATVDDLINTRTTRFVIGTSTAGWTAADCDYLCDGTADQTEINAAITALPATGGKIVILDGTYNITAKIDVTKDNISIRGNGNATILKRMFNSTAYEGVITLTSRSGCKIANLQVDGNKTSYTNSNNFGIYLNSSSNNTVTGNTCNNNNIGIYLSSSSSNTVTGNTCNNNRSTGIYLSSSSSNRNTITGNTCNDNVTGIYLSSSSNNTITGNTCNNNNTGIYLSSSSNNTITGNTCKRNYDADIHLSSSSYNTITGNSCGDYGYNYGIYLASSSNNTITGNTCNDNSIAGIYLSSSSNRNTITGNTCNNNVAGISLSSSSSNTITGNTCNNNYTGIYLSSSSNNTVTGNTCIRGTGLTTDYNASQHTIQLNGTENSYNLISNNNCMGKAVTTEGGTGNTIIDNKWSNSPGRILENYSEKLVTLSGTSTTIDLSLANVFTHTLSGNTTYTISNAVNNQAHSFTLIINQPATVRTLTFPSSVKWQGGEIPDMSEIDKTYILTFMTVDGGTTWFGMFGGEF